VYRCFPGSLVHQPSNLPKSDEPESQPLGDQRDAGRLATSCSPLRAVQRLNPQSSRVTVSAS
jgi:hypothetical protein